MAGSIHSPHVLLRHSKSSDFLTHETSHLRFLFAIAGASVYYLSHACAYCTHTSSENLLMPCIGRTDCTRPASMKLNPGGPATPVGESEVGSTVAGCTFNTFHILYDSLISGTKMSNDDTPLRLPQHFMLIKSSLFSSPFGLLASLPMLVSAVDSAEEAFAEVKFLQ